MISDFISNSMGYLQSGGSVIIPLLIVSFWMWFLIVLKLRQFLNFTPTSYLLGSRVEDHKTELEQMFDNIVEEFQRRRTFTAAMDKHIINNLVGNMNALFEKHIQTILILAATAPLLGLLGTVTGMIKTFEVISYFGTGNAKALAGGISEALVTTQIGLVVSIPGLMMGNFLKRRAERVQGIFQQFALQIERSIYNNDKGAK